MFSRALGGLLILSCLASLAIAATKIKEKELSVITLQEGRYTTTHRTSPVPQLRCLSGCSVTPKTVQCRNNGWDGEAVNWKCEAELPVGVRFGTLDVMCEGYDYPDDPYITVGSCSLKYQLVGQPSSNGGSYYGYSNNKQSDSEDGSVVQGFLFMVIMGVLVLWLFCTCLKERDPSETSPGDDGYPGGRRNWGGGTGPGVPPGFRPDYYPRGGDSCDGTRQRPDGPGFWSGAMTGGLLGYLFGRGGQNNAYGYGGDYETVYRRQHRRDPGWASSSWGGGPSTSTGGQTHTSTGYSRTSRC